jgi:iron complex outermembrane receptor protein
MPKSISRIPRSWVAGVLHALAGPVLLLPAVAFTQGGKTTSSNSSASELQEVVVTGIRASLQSAMDTKRDAVQVLDAISAEDIGKFPDKNLSEALQRITGVQISRQDGEGRSVSVRGSDPNLIRVEINGSDALSLTVGATDRAVDFRDLPVEFVSRIEVVKSPTADMTEGGISTVRIITRRPFDTAESFLAGSAQAVYSNLAKQTDPKVALIGSRQFLDNTLGLLLSGEFERRHLFDDTANTTGWNRRGGTVASQKNSDFNGDGILDWYPQIPRYINNRRITTRDALNSVVEWRPVNNLNVFWDATYARGKEQVDNSLLQLNADGGLFDYADSTVGADNTVNHLVLTSNGAAGSSPLDLSYRNILGSLTRTQYVTALGSRWEAGQFTLDGRLDYSSGKVHNDEIDSTAVVFGTPSAVIDYTGGAGAPNISFPGLDVTSSQGINRLDALYAPRDNNTSEKVASFNVGFAPQNVSWLRTKAGFQRHEYTTSQVYYSKQIRLSCRGDTSTGNTIAVAVPCSTITGIINSSSTLNPVPFYNTGDLGFSNFLQTWNDNTAATVAGTVSASGLDLNQYATNPNPRTGGTFVSYLDNWSVVEKTNAWFGQLEFMFPQLRVPVSGTVGLRYIDTRTNSTGYTQQTAGSNVTFQQGSIGGGYKQALPSFNLKMDLLPDTLIARFAAAKVMARPAPSQLAIRQSTDIVGLTGSRGNPGLLPFLSTDYDAGLEWYYSPGGFLSAAYFRKDISRFILNTTQNVVVNDVTYSITFPHNGTDSVKVDGLEMGGQYAFDFLPAPFNGFGVTANYTYQKDKGFKQLSLIDNSPLPFPGLSRNSYNWSVYYENRIVSARVSYNWRNRWLINASGRGNLPEFNDAYGQLDANLSINITPHVSLTLEGINLTNQQLVQENAPARKIQFETFGERFFLGLHGKF